MQMAFFKSLSAQGEVDYQILLLPPISDNKNNTMKIKKMIFAIVAAPAAMPENPNTAAIIAMIRKVTVQRNISCVLQVKDVFLLVKISESVPNNHFGPYPFNSRHTINGIALVDFFKTGKPWQIIQTKKGQEIGEPTASRTTLPGNEKKEGFRKQH